MAEAFIFDGVRTPRGKLRNGALTEISPTRLAAAALTGLADRTHLDTAKVEDVIFGCVAAVGEQGACITRAAIMAAGWDESVPGVQISRFCSSGLEAVNLAAAKVMAGQSDLVVAGGVESMSRVPMGSDRGSWQADPRESMAGNYVPQGISADLIATLNGYDRATVDAYALASQQRAEAAWQAGAYDRSVIPVRDRNGVVIATTDEHRRPDATAESLGALPPAFAKIAATEGYRERVRLRYPAVERIDHVHTAGNSSGMVDGAAALLIGTREAGAALGLNPRARIKGFANIGSEPTIMLTGPVAVTERALKRTGMTASDIDLFEVNEAFAAVALYFMDGIGAPHDRTNVNGGAIALGHPLGATGAMLTLTAMDALADRDRETALVTLCVGGGMGTATILERAA